MSEYLTDLECRKFRDYMEAGAHAREDLVVPTGCMFSAWGL